MMEFIYRIQRLFQYAATNGIFFPLLPIEDFGYLPRSPFNLDKFLQTQGACGKQALTMCTGIRLNAAGVTGNESLNHLEKN